MTDGVHCNNPTEAVFTQTQLCEKTTTLSQLEEKVVTVYLRDTFSRHIIDDVLRHGQAGRRHVANVAPVPCKKSCQRVRRSAVLQISHHCYLGTQRRVL